MSGVSWGKPEPLILIELRAKSAKGWRYWAARVFVLIAAKLLNSSVITKRAIPTLESE